MSKQADNTAADARALATEIKAAADRIRAALVSGVPVDSEDFTVLTGSTAQLEELATTASTEFQLSTVQVTPEQWEANGNKGSKASGELRCMVCNRAVSPDKAVWVHLTTTGTILPLYATEEDRADSQGMHPVGVDCARRIPPAFKSKDR